MHYPRLFRTIAITTAMVFLFQVKPRIQSERPLKRPQTENPWLPLKKALEAQIQAVEEELGPIPPHLHPPPSPPEYYYEFQDIIFPSTPLPLPIPFPDLGPDPR